MSEIIHEVSDWKVDFRVPNHTYLLNDSGGIIAYALYGGNEIRLMKNGSIKLDKRNRKFVKTNHSGLAKLIKNEKPEVGVRRFKVKSGDREYTILIKDGGYSCTCTGYNFRGKCKHIEAVAKKIE